MTEAGYLGQKRLRPGAAATVVLMHGAALAALLLVKNPEVVARTFGKTEVINIELPPPPPPQPREDRPAEQISRLTVPPVPMPVPSPYQVPPAPPVPPPDLGSLASNENVRGTPEVPPQRPAIERPAPPPVRLEARLLGANLQPPYPTSEQRMEREGRVVIRVTIGPDGRVVGAQKVSATSNAFWEATERHARARWRFRPATVDGRPVESTKTMTVVFELDG